MIMAKIIVFQESSVWAVRTGCKVSVLWQKTEAKQEPHITSFKHLENKSNCSIREFSCKFFTWLCLRYCNRFQQTYSNLSGILCKLWQKQFNIQPITVSKKNRNTSFTTNNKSYRSSGNIFIPQVFPRSCKGNEHVLRQCYLGCCSLH